MHSFEKYHAFKPNQEQKRVLNDLYNFVNPKDERDVMILKGAAGTGKTSILAMINRYILENSMNCRLAAPTGRAANVLHSKVSADVKTIHSMIFIPESLPDGKVKFNLRNVNNNGYTIYIIDESSMISNSYDITNRYISEEPLLSSLIRYVKMGNKNNKIIFVGDPYQLPPIVSFHERSFCPALDANYLKNRFNMNPGENELKEVMRQSDNSPVLDLATEIRDKIESGDTMYTKYPERINGWSQIRDIYLKKFDINKLDKVTVVCHTNKDVNWWNNTIRNEMFNDSSNLLCNGELVTIQKNNWTKEGLIYNGEVGVIKNFNPIPRKCANLHFSECEIEFIRYGERFSIKKLVCWESILSTNGNLSTKQETQLHAAAMKSNPKFRETKNIFDDEYLNAFRLRYGYASTCHKAQGGEWDTVFIHPYLKALRIDRAKWMYTACTRARSEVFSWTN
jgi:exodeoxyribonuclease-5